MNAKVPIANILALKKIAEKLNGKGLNWVLIGSTALAIQGVDVPVHDIDIMTDMESADKIAIALKEFNIEPMHYKTSAQFKSYYGLFKINEVQVEVFADLETKHNDEWAKTVRSRIIVMQRYEGMTLPLLELREEYEAYKVMGRDEKAKKILEFMEKENSYTRRRTGAS
jgi:hypothetical protein